jgi:hypothetical protein
MLTSLPAQMASDIAATARMAGVRLVETGGFVLGNPDDSAGTVLALTGEVDIERREQLFHVGGLALSTLFEWADEQELSVLAQWHTHRRQAFLSKMDVEQGLNVPGFVTSVVPDFERASPAPDRWGWWTYNGAAWAPTAPPAVTTAPFRTVTFERGRVHEH